MPLYTNTERGTVTYTPGTINASLVLPNNTVANNAAGTLTAVPEFKLAVAAYDRFILKYTLFTTHDATSDIRVKVSTPTSPTLYRAQLVSSATSATITSEANLDLETSSENDTAEVKVLVHNGANSGNIEFSFAERADGAGLTIMGGSYLEYIKF